MGVLTVSRNTDNGSIALDNWHNLDSTDDSYRVWRSYAWTDDWFYTLEFYLSEDGFYSLWYCVRRGEDSGDDETDYIGDTHLPATATSNDIRAAFEILWQRLDDQLSIPKD